ncbi:MAG: 16S rRNA (guanine(527)-N(7))-methyltransferase RsmG [Pseudomonadota bacterium]
MKIFFLKQDEKDKFQLYQNEVMKWNKKTDLIGNSTSKDFFDRHILNSVQFITYFKTTDKHILDIGTGAGIPGLICAILCPDRYFTLYEKKNQKLVFLKHIVSVLKLGNVQILKDFGKDTCLYGDILTSRGLLNLGDIQHYKSFVKRIILFKGQNYHKEIKQFKNETQGLKISEYKGYNPETYFIEI